MTEDIASTELLYPEEVESLFRWAITITNDRRPVSVSGTRLATAGSIPAKLEYVVRLF
jgi:hypothetical protein